MSIPGYDAWKTETPEDERERLFGPLCPFCGAADTDHCDMFNEDDSVCAWEESQPDPDDLMEQRREDRERQGEWPDEQL
jgi:hypothetical protein